MGGLFKDLTSGQLYGGFLYFLESLNPGVQEMLSILPKLQALLKLVSLCLMFTEHIHHLDFHLFDHLLEILVGLLQVLVFAL